MLSFEINNWYWLSRSFIDIGFHEVILCFIRKNYTHTHTRGFCLIYVKKKSNYPVCWLLFAWQKRRAEMVETLVWKDSNECMCSYLLINLRIACGTLVKSEMQAREVKCKQWLKMGNLMLRSYASVIKFSWRVLIMKHGQRLTRDLDWVSNHKNSKVQLVRSNSSNPLD